MRCHYEVLEVERTADDETIKKAYRRLALQWHPDKNLERLQEATQRFAQIQQAYEVLGDAHERAWYDRHRESILKGGVDEHYEDNSLNVFSYFSSSSYSGFDDSDKGFYSVYRHVFETIAAEDYDYLDDPTEKYPSFGDSTSNYDEVVGPFYGFWQSFSTARSFAWLDHYDVREAPNRQVVRAMEKENKKLRDAGRKKRNEEVRELVAYVRKRDKRVKARASELRERRLEQERKTEENRQRRIREQLEQIGEYKESEEARTGHLEDLREIEEALDAEFGGDYVDGDEVNVDDDGLPSLYCVACEKSFKTPKALSNHEKSRKHKDTIDELKKHMQDEDAAILFGQTNGDEVGENLGEMASEPPATGKRSKKQKRKERRNADFEDAVAETDARDDGESSLVEEKPEEDYDGPGKSNNSAPDDETNIFLMAAKDAEKVKTNGRKKANRGAQGGANRGNNADVGAGPRAGICDKCGEVFDSRTKLFGHLKESGHATLKGAAPAALPKVKGARKGKKNA